MQYFQRWRSFDRNRRYWWYLLLPLLLLIGLKESGITRQWDLVILDRLLRMRPPEVIDDRITIVTIDEQDLLQVSEGGSSISDRNLARTIDLIAAAKPAVIGVDIIRDGQIDRRLEDVYRKYQQVVGLAKILPPDQLNPPAGLTSDRIGFGDYEPDLDGAVRRAMLAVFDRDRSPKYSFALQIARHYLQHQHQTIEISIDRLKLGSRFSRGEAPPTIYPLKNSDSTDRSPYFDIIVNYRQIYPISNRLKLRDILAGKSPNLQDKIVLIGYTATTKQDFVNTHAVPNPEINGNIYGVEYHSQIVSQLVATALNERNFIQPLPFWYEYLWVAICTVSVISILKPSNLKIQLWRQSLIYISYIAAILASIYLLFIIGWWVSIGFTYAMMLTIYIPLLISFDRRERSLIEIAEKRRQVISETFNTIHNGPLQELSLILQAVKSQTIPRSELSRRLEGLNQQIRQIGESLQTVSDRDNRSILVLGDGTSIDLNQPTHELFYLVVDRTIDREIYPYLINLKIKTIDFQAIPNEQNLSIDLKHQLCQFLEEAIGNIGKYANGATKLQLIGKVDGDLYRLSIEDNGRSKISDRVGAGTKQAQRLAVSLKGKFNRSPNSASDGVICAIEWNFNRKF
jgi:CHASE2 domain-containing sensor protein